MLCPLTWIVARGRACPVIDTTRRASSLAHGMQELLRARKRMSARSTGVTDAAQRDRSHQAHIYVSGIKMQRSRNIQEIFCSKLSSQSALNFLKAITYWFLLAVDLQYHKILKGSIWIYLVYCPRKPRYKLRFGVFLSPINTLLSNFIDKTYSQTFFVTKGSLRFTRAGTLQFQNE